jgi:hypothetical protein
MNTVGGRGVQLVGLPWGQVAVPYKYDNEPSSAIKSGKFLLEPRKFIVSRTMLPRISYKVINDLILR